VTDDPLARALAEGPSLLAFIIIISAGEYAVTTKDNLPALGLEENKNVIVYCWDDQKKKSRRVPGETDDEGFANLVAIGNALRGDSEQAKLFRMLRTQEHLKPLLHQLGYDDAD
jgi:hypothetical protein